ncbi:MAG: TPM domain-containing protein [Desulfobacterales bacterium]|nr:TPM domain-containing protein [Desulfobacterales bacterium]
MRLLHKPIILIALGWLLLAAASPAEGVTVPERPARYVVDLAGIIDAETETKLNGYMQELEQKTTAQFVILTIESLEGESIEDAALKVAHEKWKLGRKGKDNGLLLLVAVKDRKYRIEVGYGLEGVLPDSFVGSVGRDHLVPYFRKGDYSKGIFAAALALTWKIAGADGVAITGLPITGLPKSEGAGKPDKSDSIFNTVFALLIFIVLLIAFIRNPKAFLLFFLFSSMGGRSRHWGGGGGFGGGFGSFGGGGGGGFGGGGASGGW